MGNVSVTHRLQAVVLRGGGGTWSWRAMMMHSSGEVSVFLAQGRSRRRHRLSIVRRSFGAHGYVSRHLTSAPLRPGAKPSNFSLGS